MPFESVRKLADADFPTRWGAFRILGFEGTLADPAPCTATDSVPARSVETAVALVMGDITTGEPPIVRIHSQCLTGDVFHSLRCDCRQQLELALATIADAGAGILIDQIVKVQEEQKLRAAAAPAPNVAPNYRAPQAAPHEFRTRDAEPDRRMY